MTDRSAPLAKLRPYNLAAGCIHLAQAVAIVVLADSFSLPVRATYMTGPPGPNVGHQAVTLFHLSFAWAIAAFFALSALAHFTVAGPCWDSYKTQLLKCRNPYRWLEYSLSASIMIVLIAMLVGINDIAALIALVGVNASMIGFGWMQERYETPGAGLGPFASRDFLTPSAPQRVLIKKRPKSIGSLASRATRSRYLAERSSCLTISASPAAGLACPKPRARLCQPVCH